MSSYLEPDEAKGLPGLRLALTIGVPGPWSEAAKSIFFVKKIAYQRVKQLGGEPNEALRAWTGQSNAPQAILDDEPSRSGWAEILLLAERMQPDPALIPADPAQRALVFGLSHEICGEQGLGWTRRLQLLEPMMKMPDDGGNPIIAIGRRLASRYGYREDAVGRSEARVLDILRLFSDQLARQKESGSDYLVGDGLTAVDIYWSTFAAMLQPLPAELCPMPEGLRAQYGNLTPAIQEKLDPALLAHRDRIYEQHLELPLVL